MNLRLSLLWIVCVSLATGSCGRPVEDRAPSRVVAPRVQERDYYAVFLHSPSLAEQRAALTAILQKPADYVPRILQDLRGYPAMVETEETVANRAVIAAALVRDPSFAPILAGMLGDPVVLSECIYACEVVFALAIHACFGGWTPPPDLPDSLTTVYDLQDLVRSIPGFSLEMRPIDEITGPWMDVHRKEIEGKTEEQLIQMAGPDTSSLDTRMIAVYSLERTVSSSKNRIDLYLLAGNDIEIDASGGFRGSVYHAIYRAELARAQGR